MGAIIGTILDCVTVSRQMPGIQSPEGVKGLAHVGTITQMVYDLGGMRKQ
jgi:hypothetical protein